MNTVLIQINIERTDYLVMVLGNLGHYTKKTKQDPYVITDTKEDSSWIKCLNVKVKLCS